MAHQARTSSIPTAPGATDTTRARGAGGIDTALDGLWGALISMRVALVLILALAVLALAGTVLVQAPAAVMADPAARADWLNQVRPKYGGWTGVLDALGLFNVFESIWFRLIAAALTVSTLACSIHRIPGIVRTAMRPHVAVGDSFFEHAPQRESLVVAGTPTAVRAQVDETLRAHHYRVLTAEDERERAPSAAAPIAAPLAAAPRTATPTAAGHHTDTGTHVLYADRFRWVPFAGLVGHLAIVVIVVGALVGATFGFRDPDFVIAEGSSLPVPGAPGLEVELLSFQDSYYASTGAPSDYASDLVLRRDGTVVAQQTIRVNDPLRFEGTSFYQSFYGPAASLRVTDGAGAPLFADGVPLAWSASDSNRRVGSFTLPERDLTVWVVGTGGPDDLVIRPGQMRVEVYRNDQDASPVEAVSLDPGKPVEIEGLTFTFDRELQFSGLSIARDPGTPIVWLGCALLFIGFVIRFTVPHRRIWIRISPQGGHSRVAFASVGRGDVTLGTEYARLIEEIGRGAPAARS